MKQRHCEGTGGISWGWEGLCGSFPCCTESNWVRQVLSAVDLPCLTSMNQSSWVRKSEGISCGFLGNVALLVTRI